MIEYHRAHCDGRAIIKIADLPCPGQRIRLDGKWWKCMQSGYKDGSWFVDMRDADGETHRILDEAVEALLYG